MDVSVIIPTAEGDRDRVNRTIASFLDNAVGDVEVVVVLNGFDMEVDERAVVIRCADNTGERRAMNAAATRATGEFICRVDAHCTVPRGWDRLMIEPFQTYPNCLVVPVLGALQSETDWTLKPNHRYKFCKLLPTMEEKWWDKPDWQTIEPNMSCTGCGMTMRRSWYLKYGGVDETLPPMGAIGPECSMMAHVHGDGVFTRTDVVMGHLWCVGGYDTAGVAEARRRLVEKYGSYYEEVAAKFDIGPCETRQRTTDRRKDVTTIRRQDTTETKDAAGNVIKRVVDHYVYVVEHDGGVPVEELERKYAPKASFVGRDMYLPDQNGELVKVVAESQEVAV